MFGQPIALNDYQQLMLKISKLSPYNAVHLVPMDTTCDLLLLDKSIAKILHQVGIGMPVFASDHTVVSFLPSSPAVFLQHRSMSLLDHVATELNDVFSSQECPLRFFVISWGSQRYFSMTYNHWIADAHSIIQLMNAIFIDIKGLKIAWLTIKAPAVEDCYASIYRKRIVYLRCMRAMASLLQFSQAYRSELTHVESAASGCCYHAFPEGELSLLLKACKVQDITLNDLFVAVVARLFGQLTKERRKNIKSKLFKRRRDRIVIAIISSMRNQSSISLSNVFGVFLSFFYVSFKDPEQQSLTTLCQLVRRKTSRLKLKNTAIKQYLLFKVQSWWWDRASSNRSKYRLFSKNVPITAGISNMNLAQLDGVNQMMFDKYIRFSPTAMVCPIVFNMTTINDHLSLAISYRKACYTGADIEEIKTLFIKELCQEIARC